MDLWYGSPTYEKIARNLRARESELHAPVEARSQAKGPCKLGVANGLCAVFSASARDGLLKFLQKKEPAPSRNRCSD